MQYGRVLLTGGSGKLGQAIINSKLVPSLSSPARTALDITKPASIKKSLLLHKPDAIIHCAAMARMAECEKNPAAALLANTIGTTNLVQAALEYEKTLEGAPTSLR